MREGLIYTLNKNYGRSRKGTPAQGYCADNKGYNNYHLGGYLTSRSDRHIFEKITSCVSIQEEEGE